MSKLALKDILEAVDQGGRDLWDLFDEEQKKDVKFFLLNRYVSSVRTSNREVQEHFVLATNEYFNKHWNTLQKHPKLLWQLLCMCSHESKKIFFHQWMGFKQKKGDTKRIKFLLDIYPSRKQDELEMLSQLMTLKELKTLAEEHGYSDKEIDKLF
jgi:hypothetical protein